MKASAITNIRSHLHHIAEAIGARPTGSKANQQCREYIAQTFRSRNWEVEEQTFECINWKQESIKLTIGDREIPATISPYSLPVSAEAEFVMLSDLPALKSAKLEGKIAVLHGALTKEALMPKNFRFWNPERHREIIATLEVKQQEAVITLSFSENLPIPVIEDGDFSVPSAVVAGKNEPVFRDNLSTTIRLSMDCKRMPSQGANVIARINPGANKKIIITAHFDTKPGTPGALDNASGVCTLLYLGELLSGKEPKSGIELVALNGEDYFSNPGQNAYLDAFYEGFDKVKMVINCDGVGYKEGKTGIAPMFCPDNLTRDIEKQLNGYPHLGIIQPWYQGDHMIIAPYQIPTLAVTSERIFELIDTVIHTEDDRIELVEPAIIKELGEWLFDFILWQDCD